MMDIARSRGVPKKEIHYYDLTEDSMLFDGSLTKNPVKRVLVRELQFFIQKSSTDVEIIATDAGADGIVDCIVSIVILKRRI